MFEFFFNLFFKIIESKSNFAFGFGFQNYFSNYFMIKLDFQGKSKLHNPYFMDFF